MVIGSFSCPPNKRTCPTIISLLNVAMDISPPLQTAINGKLRVATGSLLVATFISFFVGTIILITLILITQRHLEFPMYDTKKIVLP